MNKIGSLKWDKLLAALIKTQEAMESLMARSIFNVIQIYTAMLDFGICLGLLNSRNSFFDHKRRLSRLFFCTNRCSLLKNDASEQR